MKEPFINTIALHNSSAIDDDGWALIAPFGRHPKTRLFRESSPDGRTHVKEQKFIQVLDNESADALVSSENSFFRKLKRALVGIPVFKGHGDLNDHDPKAIAGDTQKIKLGVIDKIRKRQPAAGQCGGIEAHFALDNDGAEAVAAGWKLPSAFWLVMPIGNEVLADGQKAILARPFKLLSVALTQFPNISGVESLANSRGHVMPSRGSAKSMADQPTASTKQTQSNDDPMKQLLIGWLAAQGKALANDATEQTVFDAFNQEMLTRTTSITALDNEKTALASSITTLSTERDAHKQRADEANMALANEQTGRRAERRGRAELATDLAIQRGKKTVAERETIIASLENSADFERDAKALLDGKPVIKTAAEAISGKQQAALSNEEQQIRAEYQ